MIIGIAGYSGGGKTTFIEKLIPVLKGKGFSVMVIKIGASLYFMYLLYHKTAKSSMKHRFLMCKRLSGILVQVFLLC